MIAPDRTRSPLDKAADALTLLTVFLLFGLSAMTLAAVGIAYDQAGGSFLQKFHPSTYMACLALAVRFAAQRNPFGWLAAQAARFPGAAYFVATWIAMILFAALVQHIPISPIIDSFLCSVALLVLYADADDRTRAALRLGLHAFMFVNACIGIGEFAAKTRLTPFVAGGKLILHDYRSTALLGHPLINAAVSACYALMLIWGADRAMGRMLRLFLVSVQSAALVTFGGRTAIVLCVALAGLRLIGSGFQILGGRRFDMRGALLAALAMPLLLAGIALLAQRGLFDGLVERFVDDKGSADARQRIFQLFDYFSLDELLLGPDQQRLATIQNTVGIEYGIESSWFGLLFEYGAVMTLFFCLGFAALLWEYWRRSRPGAWPLFVYILVQLTSAAGVSVKTLVFGQFAVLLLAFFCDQREAAVRPRPARAAPRFEPGRA